MAMDLASVISKNIDEYLKPKYPIYRVKYVESTMEIFENEISVKSEYKERICELKEENPYIYKEYFDEDYNIIKEALLEKMKDRNHFHMVDCPQEQIIVIGLERLA